MLRILMMQCCLLAGLCSMAKTIVVKNLEEFNKANKEARPGDVIELQNGEWNKVTLSLNCTGTKEHPITVKSQTAGKVFITGKSRLRIGGSFIVIDGLNFVNGFAGDEPVISFRIDKNEIANNCRVTNTVINDFNNPRRLDENYWVSFYGKHNRLDHCSFLNKKNMGVLLAVILDDERSRENFHSIDHNYFGVRLPLASNSGEIIRVGVSQHCEFNSNTQIADNFFENCDGETEIVSIKSCRNIIRNNLFKECQGDIVLRHGNYNTVVNNVFLGNNKEGTGGVRIINKGQWVVNNFFYKCRGTGFRSPLSMMYGVFNSPAYRYVEVTEAVVANNSFFECTPLNFSLGSDTERTVKPTGVQFLNNLFYNSSDSLAYLYNDDLSGIHFSGNSVSRSIPQNLAKGFTKTLLPLKKEGLITMPSANISANNPLTDSIQSASQARLFASLSSSPGFSDGKRFTQITANAYMGCGAKWFTKQNIIHDKITVKANCNTAEEIIQQLTKNKDAFLIINLTGKEYNFNSPVNITTDVLLTTTQQSMIHFSIPVSNAAFFIQVKAGKSFSMDHLKLDLTRANTNTFITTDTSGSSNHSNIVLRDCGFTNASGIFFNAAKTSVSDSIIINRCAFTNSNGVLFNFTNEVDKKGYYNVEKLKITHCTFNNNKGQLLAMLRGGNDESTMGPLLIFSKNKINNCLTQNEWPLIHIFGTQRSIIEKNIFINSNTTKTLIHFEDLVGAIHLFRNNSIIKSGKVITDKFVWVENNISK